MAVTAVDEIGRLVEFLKQGRDDVSLADVMDLAERMAHALDTAVARADALLHEEFRSISGAISTLKREISDLSPDQLRFNRIPDAGRELDAVVEATEAATETIMTAAEAIMAADATDADAYRALVNDKMIVIFEACSFQDITGQRIRKVVKTLAWIEARMDQLAVRLALKGEASPAAETEDERRMRELILNGPQRKGEGVSQDAVDGFFATSDQDDIDRLFGRA
jgi:chemotaxis protein CheZ